MNILVCLKLVSQAQFSDFLKLDSADRLSSGQLVINPADEYALELALRLKDKHRSVCITVITMAPQYADYILRTALAMGADKAVHVSDAAFAGADTIATSHILSRAIALLPPQDLILCGRKALDSETGHIGPQLAAELNIPFAAAALDLNMPEEGVLEFKQAQDKALLRLRCRTPLLLSLCNGSTMIRSPGILGLKKSQKAEILLVDAAALGIEDRQYGRSISGTETTSVTEFYFRSRKHRQTDKPAQGIDELAETIKGIRKE